MYNDFVKPEIPKIEFDSNLPECIICDLDGTLALFNGKNPYDRDFENDDPNAPVVDIVKRYIKDGLAIFVSGRSEKFRLQFCICVQMATPEKIQLLKKKSMKTILKANIMFYLYSMTATKWLKCGEAWD